MDHRAFVLDHRGFTAELRPTLEVALSSEDPAPLRAFILANLPHITDPNEGAPLPGDWEQKLENGDVHEYGDYALTKFYDVVDDIGLGDLWAQLDEALDAQHRPLLLGSAIGGAAPFDPGRMGAYFQSPKDVARAFDLLAALRPQTDAPSKALAMLNSAREAGLYVSF